MMEVFIENIGLMAPGLTGWSEASRILRDEIPYVWRDLVLTPPSLLPATERRRSIASVRLALAAACEAIEGRISSPLACIFTSSDGDGQITHQITDSLAQDVPEVSPTRFSNSVHNAVAGYWSIATGLKESSTCLCAFDESFAAGLLEAGAQVADEGVECLMTAFDMRFPAPFSELRSTAVDCAVALLLSVQRSARSMACLHIALTEPQAATSMPLCLPENFVTNPAARAFPLLAALAAPEGQTVYIDYLDQSLAVTVKPC